MWVKSQVTSGARKVIRLGCFFRNRTAKFTM